MSIKKTLAKLVGIPSIAPNEKEIAFFVEDQLKNIGLKTERQYFQKNRFNLLGEIGEGSTCLLLYCHLDTVAPCKDWRSNPFKLKVVGDLAYGLGVHDMKGGITAILDALKNFKPKGFKIKVAFGVDEEEISQGANILVKSGWLKDVNAILVPETGTTKNDHLGPKMIVLGRRGRVVAEVLVKGKSAHGSRHELGINAIEEAAKIIFFLQKIKLTKHRQLDKGSIYPRSIQSKTQYLSVPENCEITLDRSFVPPETQDFVVEQLKTLVNSLKLGSNIEVKLFEKETPFMMPYIISKTHPWVKLASRIVKRRYGRVIYDYGLSVADENYFATRCGLPVVVLGPAGGGDHSAKEWVSLKSIKELSEIIIGILNETNNLHSSLKNFRGACTKKPSS